MTVEKQFETNNGNIKDLQVKLRQSLAPKGRHRLQLVQGKQQGRLEFTDPEEVERFALMLAQAAREHKNKMTGKA